MFPSASLKKVCRQRAAVAVEPHGAVADAAKAGCLGAVVGARLAAFAAARELRAHDLRRHDRYGRGIAVEALGGDDVEKAIRVVGVRAALRREQLRFSRRGVDGARGARWGGGRGGGC